MLLSSHNVLGLVFSLCIRSFVVLAHSYIKIYQILLKIFQLRPSLLVGDNPRQIIFKTFILKRNTLSGSASYFIHNCFNCNELLFEEDPGTQRADIRVQSPGGGGSHYKASCCCPVGNGALIWCFRVGKRWSSLNSCTAPPPPSSCVRCTRGACK